MTIIRNTLISQCVSFLSFVFGGFPIKFVWFKDPFLILFPSLNEGQGRSGDVAEDKDKTHETRMPPMVNIKTDPEDTGTGHSSDIIVPQPGLGWDSNLLKEDIADQDENNKIAGGKKSRNLL